MNIIPVNNTIMNSVTYVLYSEDVDYCVLIDCGEYETLRPVLDKIGKMVKAVMLTHGHSDHIYGLNKLLVAYPDILVCTTEDGHREIQDAKLNFSYLHDYPFAVKDYKKNVLTDGQTVSFDGFEDIEVMATPGHDTSCLTYKLGMNLFTGDAYIPGVKVFYKFPRGNKEQALASYKMLANMQKEGYHIYCGHHTY